jgi:flavin reductase (DIM6/NTAB) family NADH-FMN oxidoreductase RutF
MFYEPDKKNHGLPFQPYKSCVVPRPIGWISTMSRDGNVNLAPYSQFNNVGFDPGYLMFSAAGRLDDGHRKDSLVNAEETGEFVYNMATYDLRDAVSLTSDRFDFGINEMEMAGLTPAPSHLVKPPRVLESPINIECKYYTSVNLPGLTVMTNHTLVIGRVVGVHVKDEFITEDGKIDILKIRPLARLGYTDYTSVESIFPIKLSDRDHAARVRGLSGGNV